jgi:3,4-dihydroxy 2-butanone 4-phosphate synthase/GTP cyclohydrolase II
MNDDGTMARVPDLIPYCERHGLKMITVADLIAYRRKHDKLVERVVETRMPTAFGEFNVVGYRSLVDDKHHVALVKGEVAGAADVLVRVHSECLTGRRLPLAALRLRRAARVGAGPDRARGARACCSTSPRRAAGSGCSTSCGPTSSRTAGWTPSTPTSSSGCPVDLRDYGIGAQILVDLGSARSGS